MKLAFTELASGKSIKKKNSASGFIGSLLQDVCNYSPTCCTLFFFFLLSNLRQEKNGIVTNA